MIEFEMNLSVNAEEHEMINIALGHMLDVAAELTLEKNDRILLIERLRNKSYQLWAERFSS